MKKISFVAIIMLNSLLVMAQNNHNNKGNSSKRNRNANQTEAPAPVQHAWQRDHSGDGTPAWQQSNGQWHAQYQDKSNNRNVDTYYDRTGRQIDSHTQWNKNDMPSDYNQNVDRRYHANGNYDVTKIDRPNQKAVYELKINNNGTRKTVYTDEKGNQLRYKEPHRQN